MKYISNKIISFWEKGYLYILTACLIYLAWFLSDNVGILDWLKEIAYFEYFKTSFNDYNSLPYFWWNILEEVAWRPPIPGTSAIIANPETALFSPFTVLLYFFSAKTYIKLYVLIQFVIGIVGLFLIKKKLNWDNQQFRTFSILFLFSPIVMQHIAVAYFTWYNFFLFPWLIYFTAEKNALKGILGTAAVLGLVVLQGGIYIVQYLGLFYVLYELFHIIIEKDWKRIFRIVFVPLFAVLLSWARISTTISVYGEYIRPWVEIDGYNLPFFIFYAIIPTITIPPLNLFFHSDFFGWSLTPHDSGLFWGFSLIMFIALVVKYKNIVISPNSKDQNGLNYNAIFIAASFLFIISFYKIWYYLMKAGSGLDLPLFESIKNHGIRFIMGAFFGYALIFANYSKGIWNTLQLFTSKIIWAKIKKGTIVSYKLFLFSFGAVLVGFKLLQNTITIKIYSIIEKAYVGTEYNWLRNKMEGMEINSVEFYHKRFDIIFSSIQKWMVICFIVLFTALVIGYLIKWNRRRFNTFLGNFPFFKFEMLLAIPLIFSTVMWANLASSVPYSDHEIVPLSPPRVILDKLDNNNLEQPKFHVTPKSIKINPPDSSIIERYIFPQIPASDREFFKITSENAVLFDNDGQLALKPLDMEIIEMEFRTNKVRNAINVTIIFWLVILGILLSHTVNIRNKKTNAIND